MNAYLMIKSNRTLAVRLENVMVEEIAGTLNIHADNNFDYTFSTGEIKDERHTDTEDIYMLDDRTKVELCYE